MEKNRKNLKIISIVILIFLGLSLVGSIIDVCKNGFGDAGQLPEGVSPEVGKVIVVIVWVLGLALYLPRLYIGVKGIKIAGGQEYSGKAHIIWALVLAVLAILGTVSSIVELTEGYSAGKLASLGTSLVNVALLSTYYLFARNVANGK